MIQRQRKGKNFERLVARTLGVRRGIQYRGAEVPDVDLPGWWVECKRGRRPNIGAAFRQAKEQARDGREPAAVTQADYGPTLVTITLEAFKELLSIGSRLGHGKGAPRG